MGVGRNLSRQQTDFRRTTQLPHDILCPIQELPLRNVGAAAQIRQGKVRSAIATIGRSEQGEERLILTNRQQLSLAKGPSPGSKGKGKGLDLTDKWIHG